MSIALLLLVLALIWAAMTGAFSMLNMVLGLAVAGLALLILRDRIAFPSVLRRLWKVTELLALFLRELLTSALRVGLLVLAPGLKHRLRPAIIAVPLTIRGDAQVTLLANLITLTPGTLSVDAAADNSVLYVHVLMLDSKEALIADIARGFEAKIIEVFA
ncbi:Na+/H+ antiporter subunit E [Devosia sp.]|uniref:Na+/H+ antiporter subunit E n=1 Tax=Devosia sp. TaxID=1871048 RepID=UPI00326783FC